MNNPVSYAFVIDTDAYTGLFYRELCAYCTGLIAEDLVGAEAAPYFHKMHFEYVNLFRRAINPVPDTDGEARPATMWPTQGRFNDGCGNFFEDEDFEEVVDRCKFNMKWPAYESVAIHFHIKPTENMLDLMMARAYGFAHAPITNNDVKPFKIKGFALITMYLMEERTEL